MNIIKKDYKYIDKMELKVGMQLKEDIYTKEGAILIEKDRALSENLIYRIFLNEDIKEVCVYDIREAEIEMKDDKLYMQANQVNEDKLDKEVDKKDAMVGGKTNKIQNVNIDKEIENVDIEAELELKNRRVIVENKLKKESEYLEKGIYNLELDKKDLRDNLNTLTKNIMNELNDYPIILENIIKTKNINKYLYRHCVNVSAITLMIGKWFELDDNILKDLVKSAVLHDIGKLKINNEVLNKKGKLTKEEFEEIKRHPYQSYKIAKTIEGLNENVLLGILMHHEKEDGTGYPFNLKENEIVKFAKIIAVADIFDAMTSKRVYHEKESPFKVLEMFQHNSFGKLDMNVVMLFIKKFADFYVGEKILLSNGKKGKIVKINHNEISRPLVSTDDGEFIDLNEHTDIVIDDFIE